MFNNTDVSVEYRHLQSLGKEIQPEICKIPDLDPWDPSILPYYSKPDPLICKAVQDPITEFTDEGKLIFSERYVVNRKCYVIPFTRSDGISDFTIKYFNRTYFNFEKDGFVYKIDHEFFEVCCQSTTHFETEVYRMTYSQIIIKKESKLSGESKTIEISSVERPSVIMIGLDSMSRSNFIRQMPSTYKTMQKLGFEDMLGFTKIGDNTYVNWLAMLTGKRGVTSKEFDAELDESWGICFDDFPLIWKTFSQNNYVTLFAEDRPDIATFNYFGYLCGFKAAPTDFYFRPYWLAVYWSYVARSSTPYCFDREGKHKIQLKYLEKFIRTYHGKRHFSYWWIQDMNHDYLNLIGKTDSDFKSFLEENEKYFNESIVIVFSDHGHRYDSIRETVVGRIEARLPYLSIRLPPSMTEKYPSLKENLKANSQRMSTPFDLHSTLVDVAKGAFYQAQKTNNIAKGRAYSLFSSIPITRSCFSANIPEDYCPCYTERSIDVKEAIEPANIFLNSLNDLISSRDTQEYDEDGNPKEEETNYECSKLELEHIRDASIRFPPPQVVQDIQTDERIPSDGLYIQYRIVIKAKKPSAGVFEGLVVKNLHTGTWSITGEIERNNRYGNTSSCVTDRVLKKICHCIPKTND